MKFILSLLLLIPVSSTAKVLLITHSYNRPDFIEIHAKTFKAFLHDEYEYIVFNDAAEENMARQIELTCKKHKIRCFRIPQVLHDAPGRGIAGNRHIDGIAYSLEKIGYDHNGIVVLIDSDMFLIKSFSIEKYLQDYDIAAQLQGRCDKNTVIKYLSPALVFMNMQTLPSRQTINFEGGCVEGLPCDVGGRTYYYLRDNPSIRPLFFGCIHIGAWKVTSLNCQACKNMTCLNCVQQLVDNKFDDIGIKFIQECPDNIEFFLNQTFLHYRGGSNWDYKPAEYHTAKTNALNNFMANIIH